MPDPVAALRGALSRPLGTPSLLRFVEPGDRVAIVAAPEGAGFAVPELEAWCRRAGASEVVTLVAGAAPERPGDGGWRALGWTRAGIARVAPAIARADKLVLSGAISFHPLAGFGGGALLLLPLLAPETTDAIWARAYQEAPAPSSVPGPAAGNDRGLTGSPSRRMREATGCAGERSRVRHPLAQAGVLKGNPVQAALGELLALAPPAFLVELAYQRGGRPAAVFAGDPAAAHAIAADFLRKWHAVPLEAPFDWVLCDASGGSLAELLPALDMARAALRPGGVVIARAVAPKDPGGRAAPLLPPLAPSPHCVVVTEGALAEEARAAGLRVAGSPEEAFALARALSGDGARIALLPEPTRTLPAIASDRAERAPSD